MKKLLFLFLCVLSSVCNAQRLNGDGLKMVSKVVIGDNRAIEFSYDSNDNLKQVIYTYIRKGYKPYCVYKDVITKNGNQLTQKSYLNGKIDNDYKYVYKLNSEGKISFISQTGYCDAPGAISIVWDEIKYRNNRVYWVDMFLKAKLTTPYFLYEPSFRSYEFGYNDNGYFYDWYTFSLTEEQTRKYAPHFTEDEFKEAKDEMELWKSGEYKKPLYSMDKANDTNIGLSDLYNLWNFTDGFSNFYKNPLFYTEWIGLREYYLVDKKYEYVFIRNSKCAAFYDIDYGYDERGNIVSMDYIYYVNDKPDKRRNIHFSIEYLEN